MRFGCGRSDTVSIGWNESLAKWMCSNSFWSVVVWLCWDLRFCAQHHRRLAWCLRMFVCVRRYPENPTNMTANMYFISSMFLVYINALSDDMAAVVYVQTHVFDMSPSRPLSRSLGIFFMRCVSAFGFC